MLKVADVTKIKADPRSVVSGLGLSSTLYGIEIEIENCRHPEDGVWWAWTEDGSLRNYGRELVLKQPTGGKDLENALVEFSTIISTMAKKQKTPPEITDRCSVHTHIDFRGSTFEQVLSFFIGFCLFESALYTIGGKDRYDSIYCPGLSSCQSVIKQFNELFNFIKEGKIDHVRDSLDRWSKYTSVNLGALRHYGSVEVRSHKGTLVPDDIILWIKVMDKLKVYTDNVDPVSLVKLAYKMKTSFAREVFDDLSSHIMTDNYTRFNKNNLRNALDCIYWKEIDNLVLKVNKDIKAMADAIIQFLGE